MSTVTTRFPASTPPTEADACQAQEAGRRLTMLLESHRPDPRLRIEGEDRQLEGILIPNPALELLADILTEMGKGNTVTVVPINAELTTQQAADLLKVSRPYLIGLLEAGTIPFRLVGQHRRVRLQDLMAYKDKDDEARRRVADALAADAQELGMGY